MADGDIFREDEVGGGGQIALVEVTTASGRKAYAHAALAAGSGGGGAGDASASNQTSQITQATLTNTRLGDITTPAAGTVNYRLNLLATASQLPAVLGAGGGLKIDGSGTALPISAAALPLPTGAATETTLAAASGKLPASLGAKTGATSLSVVPNSDTAFPISAASLPLPTGAATAALQSTINTTLGTPFQAGGALGAGSALIGKVGIDQTTPGTTNLVAAGQSGAWNLTNISGTVSLPTGAATETTLAAASGKLPASLGAKTGATSLSVVPNSDTAFPISAASLPLPTGAATAALQSTINTTLGSPLQAGGSVVATGNAAAAAADSGNPVKIGAVFNSTLPTYTNGQRGDSQMDARGGIYTVIKGSAGSSAAVVLALADGVSNGQNSLAVDGFVSVFNGTTWDRTRGDVNGLVTQPHALTGSRVSYAAAAGGITNTTTAVTFLAAAGASLRNYVTGIQIFADALGSATEIAIRDGAAGTVLWRGKINTAGLLQGLNIEFNVPLKGTANTLMEVVTLTASITGSVFFNAQGFTGA